VLAAAAVMAGVVIRWRPFRVEVVGSSMSPALQPGDWALAVRAHRTRRGDVVVVRHPLRPGLELVKRVTGGPGDRVRPDRVLGPDEWFVEGDDAEASTDSRNLGPVPEAAFAGRVAFVYWPPGRLGSLGSVVSD